MIPDGDFLSATLPGDMIWMVNLEPSGIAVMKSFLSASRQEKLTFPVELFLSAHS
jgi:hypothetical protein